MELKKAYLKDTLSLYMEIVTYATPKINNNGFNLVYVTRLKSEAVDLRKG